MADNTIALGVQVPDAMKNISGLLNFAGQAQSIKNAQQQYKIGNIDLQKREIELGERKGIQELFADPTRFADQDGQPDYNKLINEGMKVAPTTFPTMVPQIIQAQKSSIDARAALNSLNNQQRDAVGQYVLSLAGEKPETAKEKMEALVKNNPQLRPAVDFAWKYHLEPASKDPETFKNAILKVGQSAIAPAGQVSAMTPSGPVMNNGQVQQQMNVNPMAGPAGPVPGVQVQNQLPPQTPVFDPNTGAPGLLGPQGASAGPGTWLGAEPQGAFQGDPAAIRAAINDPRSPSYVPDPVERAAATRALDNQVRAAGGAPVTQQQRVQTGPALGQEAGIGGTVATVNRDWDETAKSAQTASQDIGVLQNIKKYADGAVTGVEGSRRAYVTGLAGLLGMDAAQLEKTDTDLLAKNANMLALAGGNTDAARALAESANPNSKMTPTAIKKAADQLIAQRQLAIAKQEFLRPFKSINNPDAYSAALTEFNKISDPRVLQLSSMTPDEKAAMKGAMSEAEQKEFGNKIRRMQELGIVK